jgi:hypothetical protein
MLFNLNIMDILFLFTFLLVVCVAALIFDGKEVDFDEEED